MELFRTWLLGTVCAAMVMALGECLAPEGGVKRVCRLAGGLGLILAVVGPIAGLDGAKLQEIALNYNLKADAYRVELQETQDFLYETIIEENAAAYISDKAKEMGINCSVTVTAAWSEGVPYLHAVRVKGFWTAEQRELLHQVIESDLGVPRAMHHFEESGS